MATFDNERTILICSDRKKAMNIPIYSAQVNRLFFLFLNCSIPNSQIDWRLQERPLMIDIFPPLTIKLFDSCDLLLDRYLRLLKGSIGNICGID